jgi:hypothetical protein
MSQSRRNLVEQIEVLGSEERAELENFLDFLIFRAQERKAAQVAAATSEPAFQAVWSNPEDDAYDAV